MDNQERIDRIKAINLERKSKIEILHRGQFAIEMEWQDKYDAINEEWVAQHSLGEEDGDDDILQAGEA